MISRLIWAVRKAEDTLLVLLLLTMIVLAVVQIFLRNFFDSGIVWGDALVRVLVLWIGLTGAMAASRDDNHISIDVVSRYLPAAVKPFARGATYLFTCAITGLMAWHSYRFVLMEKADEITAFAGVPAWICEAVIPFAFAMISIRYLLFLIRQIKAPTGKKTDMPLP